MVGFPLTITIFQDRPLFFVDEIGTAMGYEDLSHSIRNSDGFREGIDFLIIRNQDLKSLKTLILSGSSSQNPSVISPNAPSFLMITEGGLYALAFRSNKAAAVDFRRNSPLYSEAWCICYPFNDRGNNK